MNGPVRLTQGDTVDSNTKGRRSLHTDGRISMRLGLLPGDYTLTTYVGCESVSIQNTLSL